MLSGPGALWLGRSRRASLKISNDCTSAADVSSVGSGNTTPLTVSSDIQRITHIPILLSDKTMS